MKTIILIFFLFVVTRSDGGEFKNVKSAIVAGTIAHMKAHPPKGHFTIVLGYNYQFELAREAPEEVIDTILETLPKEQAQLHIPFDQFPEKQQFPVLKDSPEKKIEVYYMGGFEYLDEDEIQVIIGYSWQRLKMHKNSYSVKMVDGVWIAESTGLYF